MKPTCTKNIKQGNFSPCGGYIFVTALAPKIDR